MIKVNFKHLLFVELVALMTSPCFPPNSALDQVTISRRDLVIDLGNGLNTDAQLTFPSVGDGPFSGVLIIHVCISI